MSSKRFPKGFSQNAPKRDLRALGLVIRTPEQLEKELYTGLYERDSTLYPEDEETIQQLLTHADEPEPLHPTPKEILARRKYVSHMDSKRKYLH